MISVQSKVTNSQGGVQDSVDFGVKNANAAIIFDILRSQIYSDPILAVIREYSTNAYDAHVATNKKDVPILITAPTMLDCFFKVRDYGTGLSDEDVKNIYASYGESSKRNTNEQTGMLGIGCKSGFAYGDSFMVNSYQGGKLSTWNAYIDPSRQGKMALMYKGDTTEADGIEIVIPVKTTDIDSFISKIIHFFPYFKTLPNFANLDTDYLNSINAVRSRQYLFQGTDWKLQGSGQAVAVMGNIGYPISANVFADEMRQEIKDLLRSGLVVEFPLGQLEFAASREALQYTPTTKKNILARLSDINIELGKEINQKFDAAKTLWEKKLMYRKVFTSNSPLYNVRHLFTNNILFNGKRVDDTFFRTSHSQFNISHSVYTKEHNGKIHRSTGDSIPPSEATLVVENDTAICNGIVNRVVGVLYSGKYEQVHVLTFPSPAAKSTWMTDSGYDGSFTSLITLPKEPLNKYYPVIPGSTSFANTKHSSKEFEFDVTCKNSIYGNCSDFWKQVEIDLDNDAGVYVEISRFEFRDHRSHGYTNPSYMHDIIGNLKMLNITVPTIYGFKSASSAKATKNPKMIEFWVWLKQQVETYIKNNPKAEQDFVNYLDLHHRSNEINSDFRSLADNISNRWKDFPNSDLKDVFKKIHSSTSNIKTNPIAALEDLLSKVSVPLTAKPTINLKADFEEMKTLYPMFMEMVRITGYYTLANDSSLRKNLMDYVKMMYSIHQAAKPVVTTPVPLAVTTVALAPPVPKTDEIPF